jgi:hypothetical protein
MSTRLQTGEVLTSVSPDWCLREISSRQLERGSQVSAGEKRKLCSFARRLSQLILQTFAFDKMIGVGPPVVVVMWPLAVLLFLLGVFAAGVLINAWLDPVWTCWTHSVQHWIQWRRGASEIKHH